MRTVRTSNLFCIPFSIRRQMSSDLKNAVKIIATTIALVSLMACSTAIEKKSYSLSAGKVEIAVDDGPTRCYRIVAYDGTTAVQSNKSCGTTPANLVVAWTGEGMMLSSGPIPVLASVAVTDSPSNDSVVLIPGGSMGFLGWSNDCSGTGSCLLPLDHKTIKTASATFAGVSSVPNAATGLKVK